MQEEAKHPLQQLRTNLAKLESLAESYPKLFVKDNIYYISAPTYHDSVELQLRDVVLVGDVLGKKGWVRKPCGLTYNWEKTINEVKVIIVDAEAIPEADSLVPPSAFPLQLAYISV